MLPYVLMRLDMRWQQSKQGKALPKLPSTYIQENMFITTSGNFSVPALQCAISTVGIERVLFSVDYPFESNEEGTKFIEQAPLSAAEREKICYGNAQKLLKL